MSLTVYAFPAMVAFLVKIGIVLYSHRSRFQNLQTQIFLLFLLSFAVQNVVEIGFFTRSGGATLHPPGYLGRLWFSGGVLLIAFFLHFALITALGPSTARRTPGVRTLVALLYVPPVALQVLLWSGPLLIIDFEPMAYTFTKIPGPLYFLWEVYVVSYFGAAIVLLMLGAATHGTAHGRLQNKMLLVGFIPLVTLGLGIIGLQRFGFRGFNATATLPITSTFLLIVATYAIYRRRLPDVAFYIPWSKVRRHKTELYKKLDGLAAEIANLDSPWDILERIAEGLRCRVALLGGPQPWSAAPLNDSASGARQLLAEFPNDALEKIDRIVTADEIAHTDPKLYELMNRYKVGAIVPFRTHGTIPGYCLLLGEQFNEEIYSSLDFKVADRLFSAMAQRFFEDFLLVRSQLDHVQEQLHGAKRNLMRAEQNVAGVRLRLTAARKENRMLRDELARLRRANFRLVQQDSGSAARPTLPLAAYLAEREKEAVVTALERTAGGRPAAARLLGIPLHTLDRLIEQYRIDLDGLREP